MNEIRIAKGNNSSYPWFVSKLTIAAMQAYSYPNRACYIGHACHEKFCPYLSSSFGYTLPEVSVIRDIKKDIITWYLKIAAGQGLLTHFDLSLSL